MIWVFSLLKLVQNWLVAAMPEIKEDIENTTSSGCSMEEAQAPLRACAVPLPSGNTGHFRSQTRNEPFWGLSLAADHLICQI